VPFLYNNEHFKGLVRRINSRQNHLINSSFEIDPELLKENKEVDEFYKKQDQVEAQKKRILPPIITEMVNNTFNITNKIRHNPFEDLIERYEEFFASEQIKLNEHLNNLIEKRSVWESMKESLLLLNSRSKVDFAYKAGVVSQSDFDAF
jgi:hypothetical protein